ncbi:unnamed protein product [Gulo gulo]|uniref:Uncharacterized protein n=1 Tax=Gulo gulo TaxID=48420 RepID=A0A9X9LL94_GULGU|nr:unnamed protein product [Gulo gulo]
MRPGAHGAPTTASASPPESPSASLTCLW